MTSSGKSVKPSVPYMITMELPHIWLISEAISQLIFINDPPNQSLIIIINNNNKFILTKIYISRFVVSIVLRTFIDSLDVRMGYYPKGFPCPS